MLLLIVAPRFYPSSKTCSSCGSVMDSMPLSIREWDCPCCGSHHDRDVNAAVSLKKYARIIA
ncbi:zinc ribbon domain-containing protein [Pelotomaculum sp. FP]|uniref:zinc ribbon domain-containing protein n=1 Tax=Pelotomaculum sp. FP TaxID=261474 RepID=UPI00249EE774|nr:zinc ribbon domain-containing protein [Pelotomaculum sp. FP]